MGDFPEWVSAIAAVIGVVGAVGASWAVAASRSMRSTLDLLTEGNQGLRDSLQDAKDHAEHRESAHAVEMRQQEEKCREQLQGLSNEVAHLSGQVHALQSGIVATLMAEVRQAITDAVHAAIINPERRTA